jgi:3',5'-cyclic AMP phosphodiesterase CpdA
MRLRRRELLLAGAAMLAGCGSTVRRDGSTLHSSFLDRDGSGRLGEGPAVALVDRTELAPRSPSGPVLATAAHVTDAHVLDPQSPARVTFLDRLGPPFATTFRPQEALTVAVLAGTLRAVDALAPQVVIQGGDLIDNAQRNELDWGLAALRGGRVDPGAGRGGYVGVQSASNPDPFYYRPDVDAPRYPGLLAAAVAPLAGAGLRASWVPVLGDHDLLVQGVLPPTPLTRAIAVGDRAVWELPPGMSAPAGRSAPAALQAPDGQADVAAIEGLITRLLDAPSVTVPADPRRRELEPPEVLGALRAASAASAPGAYLDYAYDVGPSLRLLVLDLVRREGGSGGAVHPQQARWLASELAQAGERWVLVVSHQPLASSQGGEQLLALLDRSPRVIAALCGHTHRNRIAPRPTSAGGYWLIQTCSLIDYPQQARALRVRATAAGGVAIETWMLDHVEEGGAGPQLGTISRELSYLDAQGGRPQGFAGGHRDRNVRLFLPAPMR